MRKSLDVPLTAAQCEFIRSFLEDANSGLVLISASEGLKTRTEADKRNAGADVLGFLADIQTAGMPKSLAQAWLLGFRLKDDPRPPPGAS